jgi:hypothetical protein
VCRENTYIPSVIFHYTHVASNSTVAMKMIRFKNASSGSILLCLLLLAASSMHVTRAQEEGIQEETDVSSSSSSSSSIVVENKDASSSNDVTSNSNDADIDDGNSNSNATTKHYIRGGSSSADGILDFERELQRAVRCVGRGATCLRTNDCCDPLSCRSNTCQVRKEILKLASSIAILLSFFLNV